MDAKNYVDAIVGRCALLVTYYDHPARRHMDRGEMGAEMGWLDRDARRWGLTRDCIDSGVLAELRRQHNESTALHLHGAFMEWSVGRS